MIDLGDSLVLSITTYAADGVTPADANPIPVLTITLPDGTTQTPVVNHPGGAGVYTASVPTSQAGLYSVKWTCSSIISAYQDAYWVAGDGALLVGVADAVKIVSSIGGSGPGAGAEEEIRATIAACRGPMEDLCGPILTRAFDEWHDGGSTKLFLDYAPVLTVTGVSESSGTYYRALTEQALSGASFDAYGYTLDKRAGTLVRRSSGSASVFTRGLLNVRVQGTYGRAYMSPSLQMATRHLFRWLWQTTYQGQGRAVPTGQGANVPTTVTPGGFTIPMRVAQIAADEVRIPAAA